MEPTRKFKIIVNSKECGTCSGATPSAVAKKVVKKLCGTSSKVVKFSLKECKRGCERVCGPYQGRMEKLDKPYTRAGKKITHRVVCGKVRKMRGGRELVAEDFSRPETSDMFHIEEIDRKPHVFFGGKYNKPFKFVVFNIERLKLLGKKSVGIDVLEGDDVNHVINLENLSLELQYELSRLREFLKDETEYRTIREFLKKYDMLQNIVKTTRKFDEKLVDFDGKYTIYFYSIAHDKYSKYILVFDDKYNFIIIDLKSDEKDIVSIEEIFGNYHYYGYIYKLIEDKNIPEFIKEKLREFLEKTEEIKKEIKKEIIEQLSTNRTNMEKLFHELYNKLFDKFVNKENINKELFDRLYSMLLSDSENKIKKSQKAHMNNNSSISMDTVYGTNFSKTDYNSNQHKVFFEKGKQLASNNKNRMIKKEREETEQKERSKKKQEEKTELEEKLEKYKHIINKIIHNELFFVDDSNLNKIISNAIPKNTNISDEDLEFINMYAQKIRKLKKITDEYLNKNPKMVEDVKTKNNKRSFASEISDLLKQNNDLSDYRDSDVIDCILYRLQAKNTEFKKSFIKPIAKHYVHENPSLTKDNIEKLTNNNINEILPKEVKNKLRYVDKRYIRYQIKKAINKRENNEASEKGIQKQQIIIKNNNNGS